MSRTYSNPLGLDIAHLSSIVKRFAQGDFRLPQDNEALSCPDFEDIYQSLSIISTNMTEKAAVLEDIEKGIPVSSISLHSDLDLLGIRLNGLIRSLVKASEEVKNKEEEIRNHAIDIEDASKMEIEKISQITHACLMDFASYQEAIAQGNRKIHINEHQGNESLSKICSLVNLVVDSLCSSITAQQDQVQSIAEKLNTANHLVETYEQKCNFVSDILNDIENGSFEKLASLSETTQDDILIQRVIGVMKSFNDMAYEASRLYEASARGDIKARGDVSKFKGAYADLIKGINHTFTMIEHPVEKIFSVLQEMSKGNLHVSMDGEYYGEFADIKEKMNLTILSIRNYVLTISDTLEEISSGNLNVFVSNEYHGDFVKIRESLNHILNRFNEVMHNFNLAALQVSAGSQQVSSGSQSLAQGSTEQASSIEELNRSIGIIASQSKENALRAKEVYELAKGARDGGEKGNQTMGEMLKSMEEINDSSINISKIIKVIDDIAFQTNILALNAAVEAARAGTQGKGFAVVAEEVRNLAARSAKAAEETTMMIQSSIEKVRVGTEITKEIALALKEIADGAVTSTEKLNIIANASSEQASGIERINIGIDQISAVVQSNSATAEESAAASEELSSQAEMLRDMLGMFKIRKDFGSTQPLLEEKKSINNSSVSKIHPGYDNLAFQKY